MQDASSIVARRHLVLSSVVIFLYVGGDVSIGSFLINFMGNPIIALLGQADAARHESFY